MTLRARKLNESDNVELIEILFHLVDHSDEYEVGIETWIWDWK